MTIIHQTRWQWVLAAVAACWLSPVASQGASAESYAQGQSVVGNAESTPQDVPTVSGESSQYIDAAFEDGDWMRYSLSHVGLYATSLLLHARVHGGAICPALHAETPQSRHTRLQI